MSGLFQKDICLLLGRRQTLLILLAVGVMMGFSTDGSFVIGYLTMLTAILTISTISYDEFDNGYPFLMTLPITPKLYVQEKFVFCGTAGLCGWCISCIIFFASGMARGTIVNLTEALQEAVIFIPLFVILLAIMLPIQLKFGAEKSRLAIAIIGGGAFAVSILASKFFPEDAAPPAWMTNMDFGQGLLLVFVIGILAASASYVISVRIMQKKEY